MVRLNNKDSKTPQKSKSPNTETEFLKSYNPDNYPRYAIRSDVVLLTVRLGQLNVLLVQRDDHPHRGRWALPGGFLQEGEELDHAALRRLREETGVDVRGAGGPHDPQWLEQLRTFGKPKRDPRMRVITVSYLAFADRKIEPQATGDMQPARYWALDELDLPELGITGGVKLAFDHDEIIAAGVERARAKLEYTTLATAFVNEPFTLGELRRVYEAVWGVQLHEANFRRKVLSTEGFVEPTGDITPTEGRPAQLYKKGDEFDLAPPIMRPTN